MTLQLFAQGIQAAIRQKLLASGDVSAFVGTRIYDDVPEDETFPYLTVGDGSEDDWGTDDAEGSELRFQINTWSRQDGRREARAILSAVFAALHDQGLAVEGANVALVRHEMTQVFKDADLETYHGVSRYHILSHPS